MPTYEYRCNGCQREFEIQQKMSDPDLVHCDVCGQDKLEKLISWTSVRSNSWQAALTSPNPKEAMKGLHAVDRSRPPSRAAPAAPAAAHAAAPAAPDAVTATTSAAPAAAAATPATADAAVALPSSAPSSSASAPSTIATASGDDEHDPAAAAIKKP